VAYDRIQGVVIKPRPGGDKEVHHLCGQRSTSRCVLSEGEIKVSDKITLRCVSLVQSLGYNCFPCLSCWMRVLRCCFGLVVHGFWTLEGTLFVWSFPRVRYFELFFLSLLVLSIVSWLVLRVSVGSGIGSWVT
jgi:hypothetical protein